MLSSFFLGYAILNQREKPVETFSNYKTTPWLTINLKKAKLAYHNQIKINSTVFTYYSAPEKKIKGNNYIFFKACRFLTPGPNLYYRLAVDGEYLASPKILKSGCSIIRQHINPKFDDGMISLFVYYSNNGDIGRLRFSSFKLKNGNQVNFPFYSYINYNPEQKQLMNSLPIYSRFFVKVSLPKIILLNSPSN